MNLIYGALTGLCDAPNLKRVRRRIPFGRETPPITHVHASSNTKHKSTSWSQELNPSGVSGCGFAARQRPAFAAEETRRRILLPEGVFRDHL